MEQVCKQKPTEKGGETKGCVWKSLKRCGLPVLMFWSRLKVAFRGAKPTAGEKSGSLRDQKLANGYILNRIGKPKMEIPDEANGTFSGDEEWRADAGAAA